MSMLKELGLRTPKDADDPRTRRFLEIVQAEAAALNKVFFIDTSEGRDSLVGDCYCQDLSGWLVGPEDEERFEILWGNWGDVDSEFFDLSTLAKWRREGDDIRVTFRPINLKL